MWKLLTIFIFSMIMAWVAEKHSVYRYVGLGEKKYIRKDKIFFIILTISMAVFVGLRTSYNDTFTYRYGYEMLVPNISNIDWALGANPGYNLVLHCFKYIGISTQNYLMIFSVVTICIYMWFIRKYSNNLLFSVFLFFTMGCYTFTMAAIKQTVAVAFCLIATDRVIQRKMFPFVFWVLFASTFHPYSLMYLATPFLAFNPWTNSTYWMMAAFGVAGVGLETLMGTIVSITDMMGEEYNVASFIGEGVNIFRLAVVWVPVLLSFLARKFLKENDKRAENLIMNLSTLNAEIMFIALFGTANYFARLANYFLIFQTIALPDLFKFYNKESRNLLKIAAIIGYLLYFYYANAIAYGGFDGIFKKIGLLEYFRTAF